MFIKYAEKALKLKGIKVKQLKGLKKFFAIFEFLN